MKKKVIPYCPKPRNAFERGLFKYFEGKKGQDHKEENQKRSLRKEVSIFLERIKLERKDLQVISNPYLLYLKRLFFYKSL